MSFHAKGKLVLINDDNKEYSYDVETFGFSLVLTGKEGTFWYYIQDQPAVLVDNLKN